MRKGFKRTKGHIFFKDSNSGFRSMLAGIATMLTQLRTQFRRDVFVKLLPLISVVAPLALLYCLNPPDPYLQLSAQVSFFVFWKGRAFQLFFVWLIALEFIFNWENLKPNVSMQRRARFLAIALAFLLPTIYVIFEYYLGLNVAVANFVVQSGVAFPSKMMLAVEYLVFSGFFSLIVFFFFGKKDSKRFALPALFVGLVGILYAIDNVFSAGQFTPFQIIVPLTTTLASKTLGFMGYSTLIGTENGMPTLQASGALGTAKFAVAWPCAGVESLLIFTAVALLFMQQMSISWKAKTGYFVAGAAVAYLVNIVRIVTLFTIGVQFGVNSDQVKMFHNTYGALYSLIWIVAYPLIILAIDSLRRTKKPQMFVS